jgi:hypothetical protein
MPVPTLRRILKYTPVVVLGLLVVAWVVSSPLLVGYAVLYQPFEVAELRVDSGDLAFLWWRDVGTTPGFYLHFSGWESITQRDVLGGFQFAR